MISTTATSSTTGMTLITTPPTVSLALNGPILKPVFSPTVVLNVGIGVADGSGVGVRVGKGVGVGVMVGKGVGITAGASHWRAR